MHSGSEYFDWLVSFIGGCGRYSKLFNKLNSVPFVYLMAIDGNRAEDGIALRSRFEDQKGYPKGYFVSEYGSLPCSVLEMMIALCIRCEEDIMGNDIYGDRTGYWFYQMLKNLGLDGMTDSNYDDSTVDYILDRFLYRQYSPDGTGGLFKINNPNVDCRSMEIWMQLNWYLNDYI